MKEVGSVIRPKIESDDVVFSILGLKLQIRSKSRDIVKRRPEQDQARGRLVAQVI
jgi:hypothetical protein